MHVSGVAHRAASVLLASVLLFTACDVPTSGPSLETETSLNTPVVVDKTFSFLGGPRSENEPLIDTTTSTFDSLFVVDASDQSIAIEEEVSSFDVGSLDEAMDKATEGVGTNTSLSEAIVQRSDLASQPISASLTRSNGVPPPSPSSPVSTTSLIPPAGELPFPNDLLEVPELDLITAENATVQQATLTSETNVDGTTVNEMTFTLDNNDLASDTLTNGAGDPPVIEIEAADGSTVAHAAFGATVAPGTSETVSVSVAGTTIGENAILALTIDGNDSQDELTTTLSPLRYQEVTLGGVDEVGVRATATDLSTRDGDAGSQFAGIKAKSGSVQLEITNNLSFPVAIDSLQLTNNAARLNDLPSDFPAIDLLENPGTVDPGQTTTLTVELDGKGIASGVDVLLSGTSSQSGDVVTIAADDNLQLAAGGTLNIDTMYFWPQGEELHTGGVLPFTQNRVRFEEPGDFVELAEGTLSLDDLVSEPIVGFESFTLSFPDLRVSPFRRADSLTLSFVRNPSGSFEFSAVGADDPPRDIDVSLDDVRLQPTSGTVRFHAQGTLETITSPSADNLRALQVKDEVRTGVRIRQLDVRAIDAGIDPFAVNVTADANTDGRLDLSDRTEAGIASFTDLDGLTDNVDGITLRGSTLKVRIRTDAGTDAQVYTALQGRQGAERPLLGGKGDQAVTADDPLGDDFYDGANQIARDDVLQFGVEGAPTNEPVTRSVTLTNENSTVDDFVSALPSSLRFVAQARLTGDANNRLRLRRPLTFETGLSVSVPVRFDGSFTVQHTVPADFSSLSEAIDPETDASISSAEVTVKYTNGTPIGVNAQLGVLSRVGTEVLSIPGADETIRMKPAPTTDGGTADGTQTGSVTVDLNEEELRALADGRELRLHFTIENPDGTAPTTVRATDPIELSLQTRVEASVGSD